MYEGRMIKTLKRLERNLGIKLQDNVFCLAVDTATKSGIAMIEINKGKLSITNYTIQLPKLSEDSETKAEKYEEHLSSFCDLVDNEIIKKLPNYDKENSTLCLENSFLKMNVVTFGFLRALQGIVYAKLRERFNKKIIVYPISARNLVNFKSILPRGTKSKDKKKEIMKFISNIVEEEIKDDNCADALLLAFAALKK